MPLSPWMSFRRCLLLFVLPVVLGAWCAWQGPASPGTLRLLLGIDLVVVLPLVYLLYRTLSKLGLQEP